MVRAADFSEQFCAQDIQTDWFHVRRAGPDRPCSSGALLRSQELREGALTSPLV